MDERMSLEQVRDRCISWLGDVACNGSVSGIAADDIRQMFAHLATPAQTVDVDAIKRVISELNEYSGDQSLGSLADILERAIGEGE